MTDATNEETKRKFREALERKNLQSNSSASHKNGQSKVQDVHGSADHKREFRRKSG